MNVNISPSLKTALVTSVHYENGAVTCDVRPLRRGQPVREVMIPGRFSFEATAPEEGDRVTIQKTDLGQWVLRDIISVKTNDMDEVGEEEWMMRFDEDRKTYLEFLNEEDGYVLHVGAEDDISVVSEGGDIHVSAEGGNVVIDEGGDAKKVATEDHTHEFTYDGSGEDSSIQNGTTEEPDDVTEVDIE